MRSGIGSRKRQRGAVAIMVGLTIIVLIGFLGIVIDLGHLYVRKTELQNAADAAALAGARQLDGTATGIGAAAAKAIATAAANASDLGQTPVAISNAQISFGPTPDGGWSDVATAQGSPATMNFIKVDTAGIVQGTRPTWFMPVLNAALASTTTNGVAVAGAPLCDGLPIFICPPAAGFKPGQSYFFASTPSVVGYFDPVPSGAPPLIPPGASEMSDIVCAGKTYCIGVGTYSSRTQAAFGKMEKAFNTRFGDYQGEFKKETELCRPDTNVKEYRCDTNSNCAKVDWMTPAPDRQSEQDPVPYANAPAVPTPPGSPLGVHWSAVRPEAAGGAVAGLSTSGYPGTGTPYTQTTGKYYSPPQKKYESYAQAGRRIITMAIADPAACVSGSVYGEIHANFQGQGKDVPVVGFGRFFMPRKIEDGKGIYVEYLETALQLKASAPDLKLYR